MLRVITSWLLGSVSITKIVAPNTPAIPTNVGIVIEAVLAFAIQGRVGFVNEFNNDVLACSEITSIFVLDAF